jgi:hypothetical protein
MQYNYTTLLAALQAWPSDADPEYVAELPNIIKLGEQSLARELGLGALDTQFTADIASGVATIDKPNGMIVGYDLYYTNAGTYVQLSRQQPSFVQKYNATATNGNPKYFCEYSSTKWLVAPPPNFTSSAGLKVRGTAEPAGLDASTPTVKTWFSTNVGDLLLEFCLFAAEKFLKNDQRWNTVKMKIDLLLPDAKAELAQLRRVLPEDQLFARMVNRPENSDATPQNQ